MHTTTARYAEQKITGTDVRLHQSALGIAPITVAEEPVRLSPAVQMAALAAHRGLRWYEGTVPAATVERNRRRNKAARRARRVHRR